MLWHEYLCRAHGVVERKELNRYVEIDIDSWTWEFLWWGIEVLYLYRYEERLWARVPVGNTGR